MLQDVYFLNIICILTTFLCLWLFYRVWSDISSRSAQAVLMTFISLMGFQGYMAYHEYYTDFTLSPPGILWIILPSAIFLLFLITGKRIKLMTHFSLKKLTLIHVIRIPVEFLLFFLYIRGYTSEEMTFDGYNFDLIAGFTAPIIYYAVFGHHAFKTTLLRLWHLFGLLLFFNVTVHSFVSLPYSFQLVSFDQPNIAIFYFPFTWIPVIIAPIIVYSHIASLYILFKPKNIN